MCEQIGLWTGLVIREVVTGGFMINVHQRMSTHPGHRDLRSNQPSMETLFWYCELLQERNLVENVHTETLRCLVSGRAQTSCSSVCPCLSVDTFRTHSGEDVVFRISNHALNGLDHCLLCSVQPQWQGVLAKNCVPGSEIMHRQG